MKSNKEKAAMQKRNSRNANDNSVFPYFNLQNSLLMFNPFARIIKSNAKFFEAKKEEAKPPDFEESKEPFVDPQSNNNETQRTLNLMNNNNEMEPLEMNSLEERLIRAKFGVLQNYQERPLDQNDQAKINKYKLEELPRIPVKRFVEFHRPENRNYDRFFRKEK